MSFLLGGRLSLSSVERLASPKLRMIFDRGETESLPGRVIRIGNKINCYYIRNTNAELTIGTSSELFLNESIVTDILYVT